MVKQVHNIRVRVHNVDRAVVDTILAQAESMARRSEEDAIETTITEEDGLVIGELWLDRQQPVRKFLSTMLSSMTAEDKARVRENATRYLDTGTHCFLHIKRDAFTEGICTITEKPAGAVNVRLNIACWPANKENAVLTLKGLFV